MPSSDSMLLSIQIKLGTISQPKLKKWFILLLAFSITSMCLLAYYVSLHRPSVIVVNNSEFMCEIAAGAGNSAALRHNRRRSDPLSNRAVNRRFNARALVLSSSKTGSDVTTLLQSNRVHYDIVTIGDRGPPTMTSNGRGRYAVIIFDDLVQYFELDSWNRAIIDKYCLEYSVGILYLSQAPENAFLSTRVGDFPLFMHTNIRLKHAGVNPSSPILHITRAGETAKGTLPSTWTVFQSNHTTYSPVAQAKTLTSDLIHMGFGAISQAIVMHDLGLRDGIQRVFFGNSPKQFWLLRLLFLDSVSYLSNGKLTRSLDRHLLVDIDDIFVAETGTRMKRTDVTALVEAQTQLRALVPDFHFNLGFSGRYFHSGNELEDDGDDAIVENAHKFWWFCHMWNHMQPHKFDNETQLQSAMIKNKQFAEEHNIPVDGSYSVAPHHSGVYPVHELLYSSWKKVWNVKVTSTEEYPHLNPARRRRGFIHKNIMVLPRQTCGLFTHTILFDKYPGGKERLDSSIQGGELFQTVLDNPISIFMTHLSNYGSDRLGTYTFLNLVKFIQCWTNLKLKTERPAALAKHYFETFPDEKEPIWGNPCEDKRLQEIWSTSKSCSRLPRLLVIGPQKTGTTALYTFLSLHHNIVSNFPSEKTFEEIQFFNGANYYRGIDWYMDSFPVPHNETTQLLFEKSATYFDNELVPRRASALLPRVKLITILLDPALRAYSWYQHMKSHNDEIAHTHSFLEVVSANDSASKPITDLRNRCLRPGFYAQHIQRWLSFYSANQLMVIDGDKLRREPVSVMNKVQHFLNVRPHINYEEHLVYDKRKGFFCQTQAEGKPKCLGRGKGRHYDPMQQEASQFLADYFRPQNALLSQILDKMNVPQPDWLRVSLSNEESD